MTTRSDELACVYIIDLSERYVQMALWSIDTLRQHNPDPSVVVLVTADENEVDGLDETRTAWCARLEEAADEVRFVEPLHRESGYFMDNHDHFGSVDFARLLYLDADTLVFGDLWALVERFERCDVAARPSDWAWRAGYRSSMAPDVVCPMNAGTVLMTREFARAWSAESTLRSNALMERADRSELASWLRSITPTAWSRVEWAFSELAWEGAWSVGLLSDQDCHLLALPPAREDPLQWRSCTIFHTFTAYWAQCMSRLLKK
jgi:hypothetical protein